jgi:hypothetical protein
MPSLLVAIRHSNLEYESTPSSLESSYFILQVAPDERIDVAIFWRAGEFDWRRPLELNVNDRFHPPWGRLVRTTTTNKRGWSATTA